MDGYCSRQRGSVGISELIFAWVCGNSRADFCGLRAACFAGTQRRYPIQPVGFLFSLLWDRIFISKLKSFSYNSNKKQAKILEHMTIYKEFGWIYNKSGKCERFHIM